MQLDLNKADALKSSSILIYSHSEQSIYTKSYRDIAILVKPEIKIGSELKGVNELLSIKMSLEIDYKI